MSDYPLLETDDDRATIQPIEDESGAGAIGTDSNAVELCKDDLLLALTVINLVLVIANVWISFRNMKS